MCQRLSRFLALTATLLLGACATHSVVQHKTPSLELLRTLDTAEARALLRTAPHNTATIFSGWDVSASGSPTPDNPWNDGEMSAVFAPGFKGTPTISSAVPITADGYFLTAAHCVDDTSHLSILTATRSDGLAVSELRVVWADPDLEPDIALVHAPVELWTHLTLNDIAKFTQSDLVLISGWSAMDDRPSTAPTRSLAAGHILEISELQHDPDDPTCAYHIIKHDAPCHPGDSGGPLMSTSGLLAVQSHGLFTSKLVALLEKPSTPKSRIPRYNAVAYAPDPAWIQSLIAKDRLGRTPAPVESGTSRPPTLSTSP